MADDERQEIGAALALLAVEDPVGLGNAIRGVPAGS